MNEPHSNSSRPRGPFRIVPNLTDSTATIPMALTLMFAPGQRPGGDAIARLSQRPAENTGFAVTHDGDANDGWVEVLAMGLAYDVVGLKPAPQAHAAAPDHLFGVDSVLAASRLEAVKVTAAPNIASHGVLPVIRLLAGLGAELARLPGLRAVGWETARSWMAPAYFMSAIRGWLVGGAFPALGLTALDRLGDGSLGTCGLGLFTGYEARIEGLAGEAVQDTAKLAARAINQLVQNGPEGVSTLVDASGRSVLCDLQPHSGWLRIWRDC